MNFQFTDFRSEGPEKTPLVAIEFPNLPDLQVLSKDQLILIKKDLKGNIFHKVLIYQEETENSTRPSNIQLLVQLGNDDNELIDKERNFGFINQLNEENDSVLIASSFIIKSQF